MGGREYARLAASSMKSLFDTANDGVVMRVHVQPGAGQDAIVGIHGDALKVRVVAHPVSGRANQAVLSLLAARFDTDRDALEITAGATSRHKRVKFKGAQARDFEKKLETVVKPRPVRGRQGMTR
jgi:uncharacterized protein (TIGR00251 family)